MASRPVLRAEAQAFRDLFGKSSEVEPKLKAALRKRMKAAADVAANDVRSEVRKPPVSGGGGRSRGLRAAIAAGIGVTISASPTKAGVVIQASRAKLPEAQRAMVRAYNKPVFRHRVFGGDTWVQQKGRPYFERPIAARANDVDEAVKAAMYDAIESLSGGSE
jgi:hypothetical protein